MNIAAYTYLLNKPDAVNSQQVIALEKILENFPYFQSARSLHLKGLYKQESFKYNQSLKNTAAYTADRTILFDLITSEQFVGIQKDLFEENQNHLLEIDVIDSKNVSLANNSQDSLTKSILSSINEAADNSVIEPTNIENSLKTTIIDVVNETSPKTQIDTEIKPTIETTLELGKPLHFTQNETHSFQEWLQLSKMKPIDRAENNNKESDKDTTPIQKQLDIIDKFIESNPKIPSLKTVIADTIPTVKTEETSYLMTETLAKVYLEQKKYSKAIQAYEILILKYPEKSSFFANRILDIQLIQQNNNS
jgi:tetratricopeptide (TPR) repeat protein